MARGDTVRFDEALVNGGNGLLEAQDVSSDTYKMALITTLPAVTDATPTLSDYTQVTGSGYTSGGETLTVTITETGGLTTVDITGAPAATWSQNGSGPTNIVAGLIYNDTVAAKPATHFVDFTADGSTAISLQDGDITYTPNASGLFTAT